MVWVDGVVYIVSDKWYAMANFLHSKIVSEN